MQINEPMRELDLGQAVVFLEKAVGEKGADYVYERNRRPEAPWMNECLYFHEGAPSCLVGHVLAYMGYEPEDVDEGSDVDDVFANLGIHSDIDTLVLLSEAQQLQDAGTPWGQAILEARGLDDD